MNERGVPETVSATLARIDEAWQAFRRRAIEFPAERMDEHLDGGWTRKQMLAHIAAWHDSANERLARFMADGRPQPLTEDDDVFNARIARAAEGRTVGEVFDSLEASFRRLRRQVSYLNDEQLAEHDGWPAGMIASNTFQHYDDHWADLEPDEA